MSAVLLSLCALGALVAKDVSYVIAMRGALLGSIVCFAVPALVFLRSARGLRSRLRTKRAHMALVGYGLASAVASTVSVVRLWRLG